MAVYTNNALVHPFKALAIGFRKLILNRNYGDPLWDGGAIPPALQQFTEGELLPWKGVTFRVGKVVGGATPCMILVPTGVTTGHKLSTMRKYRDLARRVARGA